MKNFNLLILLFVITTSILPKKIHINPSSGNINNDGSKEKPFNTLADVMIYKHSLIQSGDTLILYNGLHGENIFIKGNYDKRITIISEKNNLPKIKNLLINATNVLIRGLVISPEFYNYQGNPKTEYDNGTIIEISKSSSNIEIDSCEIFSVKKNSSWSLSDWRRKVWNGLWIEGFNVKVTLNKIYNVAYAIHTFDKTNTIIEKNLIENFSGDAIRLVGTLKAKVLNNTIKNSIELDENTSVGNHEDGIQGWNDNDSLLVSGNLVINESRSKNFAGYLQGIVFFDGSISNSRFENNIVLTEHWHGITLYGAYNCQIVNNTVFSYPYEEPFTYGPPWIQINPKKDGTKSNNNFVYNNLTTRLSINSDNTLVKNNVGDRYAYDFVKDYKQLNINPKPNFEKLGVKIIDAGITELAPKYDYAGKPRPIGNGIDIGAIELDELTTIGQFRNNKVNNIILSTFPNPFNNTTKIAYIIPKEIFYDNLKIKVTIYDVLGNIIEEIKDDILKNNQGEFYFDANKLASGIYFINFSYKNFNTSKKIVLMK
ncbi:MAG: right-handed parallel beta-helix repeat-containing protein [Melioribacteraceae bacterium]|nr:right-handed parallel beta-helix repeat-containing protein [Melioribacteraceae bacterium]